MPPAPRHDVIVVGGGAAGVAAACGAARAGARVLLLERYGFLGGAATNANVLSYCGFFAAGNSATPAVRGIGGAVLDRLAAWGQDTAPVRAPSGNWIVMLDPEALKAALDAQIAADGVALGLHALVTDADRAGARLEAVRVTDHAGTHEIAAGAFVDASGESTLAVRAGVPAAPGHGALPQAASFPVRLGGIAADAVPDRALLAARTAAFLEAHPGAPIRPSGGGLLRLPHSGEWWWMGIDLATDGLSFASLTAAEIEGRRLARAFLPVLRGLAGFAGAFIAATGPQIGIRETRHVRARGMVTEADVTEGRPRADAIARGAWPIEVHATPGRPVFRPVGGAGVFGIGLDPLRADGVDNLFLAGRTIGADAAAYGSVRVMGTGFATGHAAGVMAALGVEPGRVRAALEGQGALL